MTTGLYAFRDIRCVREPTPGTKVDTATQRLLGVLTAPMGGVILHRPREERGSLAAERRTVKVGEELALTFEGDLLFDQAMYPLNMGVENLVTPSGGSAPYLWVFDPDLASGRTPLPFTLQFGDNLVVYDVSYCIARQIQFSGVMNEVAKMRYEMFGRDFEVGAFDPAQGNTGIDPASTEVGLTNKTTLFIDAAGASPGTTRKDATLLTFTWTLDTGFRPVIHGGAAIFFDAIIQNFPKVTCEITAEFNTSMEAERVLYQAGTRRVFGLRIGGTGTDFVGLYFSGVYTSWEPLSQEEGLETVKFTIESEYDAGVPTLFCVHVSNSIASLV